MCGRRGPEKQPRQTADTPMGGTGEAIDYEKGRHISAPKSGACTCLLRRELKEAGLPTTPTCPEYGLTFGRATVGSPYRGYHY